MPRRPVVSYTAAHRRLERDLGRAATRDCSDCGAQAAEWSYLGDDPAELGGADSSPYSLNSDYYVPRCHSCHRRYDAKKPPTAV